MSVVVTDDEARRCADIVNLHLAAGHAGRWCAIRLSDGGSDSVVYDTRAEAIRHQLHETQCMYIKIPPTSVTAREVAVMLTLYRQAYAAGFRISGPDDPRELILPDRIEDLARLDIR